MIREQNAKEIQTFLQNVAWLRKYYGLSKKKMATILEISVESLNEIEAGILTPSLDVKVIFNIYKHFGIRPEDQFKALNESMFGNK